MTSATSAHPRYALATEWLLPAPIERIFDALAEPQTWPHWWAYVESVEPLARGNADGIGAVWRYRWSSRLPYRLTFDMTTTGSCRPHRLEGTASGELCGTGRWRLARDAGVSRVRYDWIVTPGKRWMNVLSPLLGPLFEWNHDQVMAAGGHGLAARLGVRLLAHHRLRHHEDRGCTTF